MAFCANCGAALTQESGFCGGCGKPFGAAGQASAPAAQAGSAQASSGLTPNVAGALAYILGLITGIIFLVLEPYKNDRFVRFHAMQSIFFCVACILFWIAWSILWGMMLMVSGYFFFLDFALRAAISLAMLAIWLFLMYQAYQGKEVRIPFIGPLAAKQAG